MTSPAAAERLSRAFRSLDTAGVIAREDFGWGRGDGPTLMYDEREKHAPEARGFVHDAVDRGPGLLFYGVFTDQPRQDPEEQAAIGREVVEALRARGLEPSWDGSPRQAIELTESAWERRDPSERADGGTEAPALRVSFQDTRLDHGGLRGLPGEGVLVHDRSWRELMYRLSPATNSWMSFVSPDRKCVQMAWEHGPRLRVEVPYAAERATRFLHLPLDQAEQVVAALADEGRLALDRFGEPEVEPWSV
ncbi:DUF6891 domain-containing protein [Nocardiopsis aegyptia]|uniref:DUF6891 domain-containing protein n=1 Tax=Nocardiopsis aegyptia TaxID=220378 RepID=A0A7Z0EN18_9ACTN|nr:hypothetical protein [Nocardiopsis aegyptia]NYJ35135.1 hypothetical protein [Nocardiopsis aegyptia]